MSVNAIFDHGEAFIKGTHQGFRYVEAPFYTYTDFPWQSSAANLNQNVAFTSEAAAQAIYASPIKVLHNQIGYSYSGSGLGNPNLPSINWLSGPGSHALMFREAKPQGFSELYWNAGQNTASSHYVDAYADGLSTQGITLLWAMEIPDDDSPGYEAYPPYFSVRFGVGVGNDQRLYSVRFDGRGNCGVSMSDDQAASWIDLETRPISSDVWGQAFFKSEHQGDAANPGNPNKAHDLNHEYNVLDVRLICNRLVIRVGSMDEPFAYYEARIGNDGQFIWLINHVRVRALNFVNLAFSAHPMKWEPICYFDSIEIPIGFYSTNLGTPYIQPAGVVPAGSDAYIENSAFTYLFGPIVNYRMVMTNFATGTYKGLPYADYTAAVRAVNLIWLPVIQPYGGIDRPLLPEQINVRHSFNAETLQIDSAASLSFNNNKMLNLPTGEYSYWGQWSVYYGQVALGVNLQRTTPNGYVGPLIRQFTGYGHTAGEVTGSGGNSTFVMTGRDRKIQLQQPRWDLPWLDGYNVFYAIAYLAQLGGVAISDMGFAPFIPNNPFQDFGDESGQPAYFLPVGSGGSILTRFSGSPLWEVMTRIANSIGYMLFFDAWGVLQFAKFKLPLGTKRVFFESDRASKLMPNSNAYGLNPGAEGCWELSMSKNHADIRNHSITIGIDAFEPRYQPTVFKYVDNDSVNNGAVFNHLGYQAPAVWVDNMFAAPGFAQQAALAMYRFLRLPSYDIAFTTWLQPDLFPMDVVQVEAVKFGTNNTRVMITDVDHNVNKRGGTSRITARFVPDF